MYKFTAKTLLFAFLFSFAGSIFASSYSYWLNGWRKNAKDKSADILMLESPKYLLGLDVADLSYAYFAPNKTPFAYGEYGADFKDIKALKKTPLEISISLDGEKYVAKNAKAGKKSNPKPLQDILLWESGRYVHHYDFKDVEFFNKKGEILAIYADLKICAQEDAFALSLNAKKTDILDGDFVEGVLNTAKSISKDKIVFSKNEIKATPEFSAAIWVKLPEKFAQASNKRGLVLLRGKNQTSDGAWGIKVDDIYYANAFLKSGATYETSTVNLKDNWNLLVITYASNRLKFYANGKLVGKEVVVEKPLGLKDYDFALGGRTDNNKDVFSMLIDEFKVWDKEISAKEVADLYKNLEKEIASNNLVFKDSFDNARNEDKEYLSLKNAELKMRLGSYEVSKKLEGDFSGENFESLTLSIPKKSYEKVEINCLKGDEKFPVVFDEKKQCFVATVDGGKRDKSFANSTNYDDFKLSVKGEGKVPFLLHLKRPASITGICPILCYPDGRPTGIQVQLSKNWHERNLGSYMMAYAKIPEGDYLLRVVYGFYGKVPAASHANLSLVGYGGSGRWEQLAIGAWGETICFDADNSLVTNMITDIRMLMAREGKDGRMWAWTDAGWGGDWLKISTASQERLMPVGLKTSYIAQGSCLTEVIYEGYLGSNREISMRAKVQTLRTNDYARTFQHLEYKVNESFDATSLSLYQLRKMTENFAYGDKSGLLESAKLDGDAKHSLSLSEKYPLWLAAMAKPSAQKKQKPSGYKALAIRGFSAKIGGRNYGAPELLYDAKADSVDLILPRQKGRVSLKKGDTISMDIELFTLHTCADDYYGDNEEYRQHLAENPLSYKTAMREALGNDLQVLVQGGKLLRAYPVEIEASVYELEIEILGGVGFVPLKISNLPENNYILYEKLRDGSLVGLNQYVFDNDYYQVEYDELRGTYSFIYNLPLSNGKTKWVLKRQK